MQLQYLVLGVLGKFRESNDAFVLQGTPGRCTEFREKPAPGFLSASQIGQVGQSELFRNRCPFEQVLTVFRTSAIAFSSAILGGLARIRLHELQAAVRELLHVGLRFCAELFS